MKFSEAFPSRYLTAEDVRRELLLTVRSVTREEVGETEKTVMTFVENDKLLVLNKTNFKECVRIFESDDANDWRNRNLVVYYDPNVQYRGRVVGGLRVKKAKTQTDSQPASQESDSDGPF